MAKKKSGKPENDFDAIEPRTEAVVVEPVDTFPNNVGQILVGGDAVLSQPEVEIEEDIYPTLRQIEADIHDNPDSVTRVSAEQMAKIEALTVDVEVSETPWQAELKVMRVVTDAQLPHYATDSSAGLDLHVAHLTEPFPVRPGEIRKFGTGLKLEIPQGFEGQVRLRSSMGSKGFIIPNAPGTIDSDYRGEVMVALMNLTTSPIYVNPGDKVAQLVIAPVQKVQVVEVKVLTETVRGEGGFGSTGK